MNKQELKKILKPLIKECIKEVIFEDGVLSGIISEVVQGVGTPQISEKPRRQLEVQEKKGNQVRLNEQRKKMLDAIGQDAFNGVDLFEGTTPTSTPGATHQGPLAGQDSSDPGVDISKFMGAGGMWKKLAGG